MSKPKEIDYGLLLTGAKSILVDFAPSNMDQFTAYTYIKNMLIAITQLLAEVKELKEQRDEIYRKGWKDGVTLFAWWAEGEQQVGTCGTTLKKALTEIMPKHFPKEKK